MKLLFFALPALVALAGCARERPPAQPTAPPATGSLTLTSSAFADGELIPVRYTSDGPGYSPPLAWQGAPSGTQSFALLCEDPDAPRGTFVHWVMYRIPADTTRLEEHVPASRELPNGARQGVNSAGRVGWIPPAPPSGTHRYIFTIYALDNRPDLSPGATAAELRAAMQGHILASGRLMGRYQRQR